MRILFVYSTTKTISRKKPLLGQESIYFGISYISAVLKQHNQRTQLVVLDRKYGKKNLKTVDDKIDIFKPDIICFSAVFSEFQFINGICQYVKDRYPDIFRVIGGVHVSINPKDEYLNLYDAICVGEGEYPILDFVQKKQKGEPISGIPNLWVKEGEKIFKNQPRSFIENLSELPFPDREIWQEWILSVNSRFTVLLGRGCPFNCTYCCNHKLKKVTTGNYVRLREVADIVSEISEISSRFPKINEFILEVETCGVDAEWLVRLCDALYNFNKRFESPKIFSTNLRIFPTIKLNPIFAALKKANFHAVSIGLESGSERVREEILNRHYSKDDIRKAVNIARGHGIKVGLYNMIGLPGETYKDFLETLAINQELQPDWHATSIFFPYEGTLLYEKCFKNEIIPKQLNFNDERQKANLDLPDFSKKQIQRSFDSFHYDVYKKAPHRNPLKLIVYFAQKFLGHNFMANLKLTLIRVVSSFK